MNANIDDKHNRFALNSDISEADIEIERALAGSFSRFG